MKKNVDEALTLKDAQGNLLGRTAERVIVLRRAAINNDVRHSALRRQKRK